MDDFCGSTFWDLNRTWNTDDPDFTPCFEDTVLVWVPCGFLWLFAASDIYYSVNSTARSVPLSPLSITKNILGFLLMVLEACHLGNAIIMQTDGYNVFPVAFLTPAIKIATYVLALYLIYFSRTRGIQSSGVQFLFWLLLTICETITFRTVIRQRDMDTPGGSLPFVIQLIYYPLIVGQLLIHCWADLRPKYDQNPRIPKDVRTQIPCPEKDSSYLNRILFSWYDGIAWRGWRRPLEHSELWALNPEDTSRAIVPKFDACFKRSLEKTKKKGNLNKNEKQITSILPALFGAFGGMFYFGAALKFVPDVMAFVSPQILNALIDFINTGGDVWKGYFLAAVMFGSAVLQTFFNAQYQHRMFLTGLRIRTSLVSAIYRKALLASNAAKRESTAGEIVNLMSVDVQRIIDLIPFVNMLWSSPLQIALALYFLWEKLGPSVLAGLGVMIILIPINAVIAKKTRQLQVDNLKNKDERVKMMNEILSGVKVLKLYAWEPSFQDQVMVIREREMATLRKTAFLNAAMNFLFICAPFLVSLSTFSTYVLIDERNVLDPQKAFVSLSLFNLMSVPITFFPMIIVYMVQAMVSLQRLNKYMNSEEIDPECVTHDPTAKDPITIENGSFAWEPETTVLKNVNLSVHDGELLAVVGTVGSGKSSLLASMLGELEKKNGRVNTRGTIAYVPQQAWIQNVTLRDNILFGRSFEPPKYEKVIEACALKPDLEILPGGDQTEIGEKGINLSGGQKQRVSLARATYNNSEVYLFDDPLSAVDSHVGKHIFDRVLGPKGLLKKKTRVLVTHGIAFLPQCDNIAVMKDGEISEYGTYQELLDKKGAFSEFLMHHIATADDEELDDPELLKELEGVVGPIDQIRKKKVSRATDGFVSEGEGSITELSGQFRKLSTTSKDSALRHPSKVQGMDENAKLIDKEKAETQGVKLSVYLDYFRAAGWEMTILTFCLYFFFQGLSIGTNLWLTAWSEEPIVNGTISTSRRDMYLGVYGALGALQAFFSFTGTLVMALGTLKSSALFHSDMLNRILRSPMSFFDTTPVGRIVNRFAKDVDVADNTLPHMIRLWLNSFYQVLATIVVISYSTPTFIAVVIPIGLLYYFVQRMFVASTRQLKRMESVSRSPIYSHFGETITGASTIRAYGQQNRFILDSEAKVDYNQVAYFPSIVATRWMQVRLETVGNLVILFAAFFAVIGRETLDAGTVGLSVTYALQITMALNLLVRWTSELEANIVAIERLQEYREAPQEAPWNIPFRTPPKEWPTEGVVEFDHYQTRYREGLDLVLRNVTCRIESGEKIGIVGRTGAGKSSLTLGLFRIVEAAGGSIVIDGVNISKIGLHDVRGRLTIIPQDPVLFSGSLRVNLDPFGRYSDQNIWQALELAHLKPFVKGLAAGLEHEISEGGDNLSVGQRQLVCLARALLRKTKILVLDEATAAVDLETDDLIQATIRKEFADSTVITIAHRLNTIMDSTRVMVLDQGQIKEFDTPANLLEDRQSVFYDMARDAGLM